MRTYVELIELPVNYKVSRVIRPGALRLIKQLAGAEYQINIRHFCSGARKLWPRRRAAWQTRKFILNVGGCDDVGSLLPFVLSLCAFHAQCALYTASWYRELLQALYQLMRGIEVVEADR